MMKRVAVFMGENQLEDLRELADGRPVAELIRQALAEYIVKLRRERKERAEARSEN